MKKTIFLALMIIFLAVPAGAATINATTALTKLVNKSPKEEKVTFTGSTVTAGSAQVFRLSSPVSFGYIKQPTFFSTSDNCTESLFESEALANANETPFFSMDIDTGYYGEEILPAHFANIEANPNQYKLYLRVENKGSIATGTWTASYVIGSK